ncbi:MAG: N-6 DNA methylase [Tannerella sp.]|jgi:type I restriction enzyme M protein|nr:N-6 DNA methylase [Tannerella sp.]
MANFRTSKELVNFLQRNGYSVNETDDVATLQINAEVKIDFNLTSNKFSINGIQANRTTIFDLTKPENHSVVMLLIKLLHKGYALSCITLEKSWQTGHSPVYLDLMLHNQANNDIFMIEVKVFSEFQRFANPENESKVKQLLSYAMQEQTTKIASFYAYNFDESKDYFANIYCNELREQSLNADDFFDRWNKLFDENDYISNNSVFSINKLPKTYENLKKINEKDTKTLFNQFLTILRLNSISDKPTAFMKMINLFLTKLADEITENKDFTVKDKHGNLFSLNGMKFQYIDGETPESFMKRLNELYKEGMLRYLKKEVIDYSDAEIERLINGNRNDQLMKAFDDLRLKKNINFSFIEIYDENTFLENYGVVKDIVRLLENYKLKYETKHQFLGDFFEELLNTSLKQEAGQFFTPYPIVDFMINSLDFERRITKELQNGSRDFVPTVIDYACGAGHFLISAMTEIQNIIANVNENGLTNEQKRKIRTYKEMPYSWADEKKIVGIEKDYRLAKTTKIASFLNGDGDAEIIAGDGINRFDCKEYKQTVLYSLDQKNEIFDYVVSNPPYSVDGFMLNFRKNGIDKTSNTFSLLIDEINSKDSAIEIYFVERMYQLLKNNGIGAIILPQSVLSQEKYEKMRRFLFDNFKVLSMLLSADITFSGTTTSPVVLFLRKENMNNKKYEILVHQSPKYSTPTASKLKNKETEFLGYAFSSNRTKSGISIIENSVLSKLAYITKQFIVKGITMIPDDLKSYSKIVKLSDILLNINDKYCGDIYPKRVICDGKPLSEFCDINELKEIDFASEGVPTAYLEIGDMKTQTPSKNKRSNRLCKKGDILVSSLTPRKQKIAIAKGSFMLTTAIHVLSNFKNDKIRDKVFTELRKEQTLQQMNALLDGFKVTYAKISDKNLYNNVLISI